MIRQKWLAAGAVAGAMVGALALAPAASANPIGPSDPATPGTATGTGGKKMSAVGVADVTQTFRNQATGWYLAQTVGWPDMEPGIDARSQWRVHRWNDGTVRLQNIATGQCADAGTHSPCNSSTGQSWYITRWRDGTIRFKNQQYGECFRADWNNGQSGPYANLEFTTCDSSPNESWY